MRASQTRRVLCSAVVRSLTARLECELSEDPLELICLLQGDVTGDGWLSVATTALAA